jgi:hypothetical protein
VLDGFDPVAPDVNKAASSTSSMIALPCVGPAPSLIVMVSVAVVVVVPSVTV